MSALARRADLLAVGPLFRLGPLGDVVGLLSSVRWAAPPTTVGHSSSLVKRLSVTLGNLIV